MSMPSLKTETLPALEAADVPDYYVRTVKELLSIDSQRRCAVFEEMRAGLHGSVASFAAVPVVRGTSKDLRVLAGSVCGVMVCGGLMLIPAVGERVRGVLFSSAEKHIAVLPLESVGGTPETQAIGDGVKCALGGAGERGAGQKGDERGGGAAGVWGDDRGAGELRTWAGWGAAPADTYRFEEDARDRLCRSGE